jgi:Asp-tRNA(Asn)/Glu-tRNA(Gln) amidotransferase A subunit family amidase
LPRTRWSPVEAPVSVAFARGVTRLKARGMHITHLDATMDADHEPFYPSESPEAHTRAWWLGHAKGQLDHRLAATRQELNCTCRPQLSDHVQFIMRAAESISPQSVTDGVSFLRTAERNLQDFFARNHLDVLLTPTVCCLPWDVNDMTPRHPSGPSDTFTVDWKAFTYPINFARHFTSGTLNCGWHHLGDYSLPVGMQVIVKDQGDPYQNLLLLYRVMGFIERQFDHLTTQRSFPTFAPLFFWQKQ